MKVIFYHYIREFSDEFPNIRFLHIRDFKKQLNFFSKNYTFICKEDFIKIVNKEIEPIENSIVLTFDDGLIDHYEYVLPELRRRNLWGIFFIPGFPYLSSKLPILPVHAIHMLVGKFGGEKIYYYLKKIVTNEMIISERVKGYSSKYLNFKNDTDYEKEVKRIINYYLDENYKIGIIRQTLDHFFEDTDKQFSNFYMSKEQIKRLQDLGNIIGLHSINHNVMANLSEKHQHYEIRENIQVLKEIIKNEKLVLFAYPYGGKDTYNKDSFDALDNNNVDGAFNVIPENITLSHFSQKYALPRYDCNLFKYGSIYSNFVNEDSKEYDSITVFTSDQPRHYALIHKLSKICNKLYAIIEKRKINKYNTENLQKYFSLVNISENIFFKKYKDIELPQNVTTKYINFNELSSLNIDDIQEFLNSEIYIVYGSSFIKNELCDFLVRNNAINIHIGLSPYYRGCSTTFWPIYDKNYPYVGGTIHKLTKGLDSGDIIINTLPSTTNCGTVFDFTMKVVEISQNALFHNLKNKNLWRLSWWKQDKNKEIKYIKYKDFNEEIAHIFLNKIPTIEDIERKLIYNKNDYINPYFE